MAATFVGGFPIGAVANDAACARNRNIGNRKAIDINADCNEFRRHQTGCEIGSSAPHCRIWSYIHP